MFTQDRTRLSSTCSVDTGSSNLILKFNLFSASSEKTIRCTLSPDYQWALFPPRTFVRLPQRLSHITMSLTGPKPTLTEVDSWAMKLTRRTRLTWRNAGATWLEPLSRCFQQRLRANETARIMTLPKKQLGSCRKMLISYSTSTTRSTRGR